MPIPERETLGPGFERRLKAALDRFVPPSPRLSSARYRSAMPGRPGRPWRLAPALIGIGAAGMALTAVAATGSPNPVIWTQRAGSVIQSVSHPVASPKAAQSPRPQPSQDTPSGQGTGAVDPTPSSGRELEPSPAAQPTERPEASPTPVESPEPTPTPQPSSGADPTPSPTPTD